MRRLVLIAALLTQVVGCSSGPSKEEEEIARNTFACASKGERIVIRFDRGEARLLMANGDRVNLYQVPSGSGIRYTNGSMDLTGKGADLRFSRDGAPAEPLEGCAPLLPPKQ